MVQAKSQAKPEAQVDRTIPANIAGKTFVLGPKAYNPRVGHNSYQWEKMVALLTKAGAKGVKGEILAASLATHQAKPDKAHFDFVSYLTRRNALATK